MKDLTEINKEQIAVVKAIFKKQEHWYKFRQAKKYWFSFLNQKEGFYFTFTISSPECVSNEEIELDGKKYIENKNVFYYPHLEIRMSNDDVFYKYFKSGVELLSYLANDLKGINFISI